MEAAMGDADHKKEGKHFVTLKQFGNCEQLREELKEALDSAEAWVEDNGKDSRNMFPLLRELISQIDDEIGGDP
jgi:hypothetical protein